ncbi:hypothetical protein EDM80_06025 [bacterium]|nr:MAG: hypothetical protein EDM80_06025 [bacterium]
MNPITATLNQQPLLNLSVRLRRGARPSEFAAVLPTSAAPRAGESIRLVLEEGGLRREFSQFSVASVAELGRGLYEVRGEDLRARWSRHEVRQSFNTPRGDGSVHEASSLDHGRPWTLSALMERLFAAAGVEAPPLAVPSSAIVNVPVPAGTKLHEAVARCLEACGLTLLVRDDGSLEAGAKAGFEPDAARLMRQRAAGSSDFDGVVGGPSLELQEVSDWQAVVPGDGSPGFDPGEFYPLQDALAAWGISETLARQACLSDAGFERLLGSSSSRGAFRLALLNRYAFKAFRSVHAHLHLPWIPVGGTRAGCFEPAGLQTRRSRPLSSGPTDFREALYSDSGWAEEPAGWECDCERGIVLLQEPPYLLSDAAGGPHDPTRQDRTLTGAPLMRLTIAAANRRPPFTLGRGTRPLSAPHLVALYSTEGRLLNESTLKDAAEALLAAQVPAETSEYLFAGLLATQPNMTISEVEIVAGPQGLTTGVTLAPGVLPAPPGTAPGMPDAGRAVAPLPSGLHAPQNAYRAGPLILRCGGETPESESYLAVEATRRDLRTGALELANLGPLAHPFHVASLDPGRAGRWFFVAGVEATAEGRVRILAQDGPDIRHDELEPQALNLTRGSTPRGMRGLLVSLDGELRLADCGPLVSDSRGTLLPAASNLISDLEGDRLSRRRAGPLHFLSVLAFSPSHQREGAGGPPHGPPGWVPVLNFRDEPTAAKARNGRGLFAEGDGRSLGRLSARSQGGPLLADARQCTKHRFGEALSDDGLYTEASGHLSTQAYFKVPGSEVFDAPLAFVSQRFEGGVPPWPPYEAQIKYDFDGRHPWNSQIKEGLWRIQYRLPFSPTVPPTWQPPVEPPPPPPLDEPPVKDPPAAVCLPYPSVQPMVGDNEVWAPSFDWVPPPSHPESVGEVEYPGPALKSTGWAGEDAGVPRVALGGGALVLAPWRNLAQAQDDSGRRDHFFTLHPEVSLAFGLPGLAGPARGRVHSGWQLQQTPALDLRLQALDAAGQPSTASTSVRARGPDTLLFSPAPGVLKTTGILEAGGATIAGKLTVDGLIDPTGLELTPVAANPGGTAANTLWLDSTASNVLKHGANRVMLGSNNLSEVTNAATARSNIGAGTASITGIYVPGNLVKSDGAGNLEDAGFAPASVYRSGGTDVAIADGGTGASDADGAINNIVSAATNRTPALADRFPFEVASHASQAGAATFQQALNLIGSLTAETALDPANDKLPLYDNSGAATDSITPQAFMNGMQHLAQATSATRDFKVLALDASNIAKYVNLDDLDPTGQVLICRTVSYTGSGTSGKTVTLTGINRAHAILIMKMATGASANVPLYLPLGATGSVTHNDLANATGYTEDSLSAPAAGSNQVLTINTTHGSRNANGTTYHIVVWGTPT